MKSIHDFKDVFLHKAPVDGRKMVNGLAAIIESGMKMNVFTEGTLFVFTNKRRDGLKIVYWNRTGFALWVTRLEKERFRWPLKFDGDVVTLTSRELEWLLDGYDITRMKPHETLQYSSVC